MKKEKYFAGGIIIKNKEILMIKRVATKKVYPRAWSFPGGKSEVGETPEQTVIREVKEEIGLDFVPEKLFETCMFSGKKVYRFFGVVSGISKLQTDEVMDMNYFSFKEALELDLAFNCEEVIGMLREERLM